MRTALAKQLLAENYSKIEKLVYHLQKTRRASYFSKLFQVRITFSLVKEKRFDKNLKIRVFERKVTVTFWSFSL